MWSALLSFIFINASVLAVSPPAVAQAVPPAYLTEKASLLGNHFSRFTPVTPIVLKDHEGIFSEEGNDYHGIVAQFSKGEVHYQGPEFLDNPEHNGYLWKHCILWYKDEQYGRREQLDRSIEFRFIVDRSPQDPLRDKRDKIAGNFYGEVGFHYIAYVRATNERIGSGDVQCWNSTFAYGDLLIRNILYQFQGRLQFY